MSTNTRSFHPSDEHDVLIIGTTKIMHRILAVAARLLILVQSLALRHRDVHTLRRMTHQEIWSPHLLIHANDPALAPSGPNPLVILVRHLLLLVITVRLQDLFFVAIVSVASSLGRISVAIIAHRLLGIDGCPHHLCFVALVPCRQAVLFPFFPIVLAVLPCKWVCSSAPHVVD